MSTGSASSKAPNVDINQSPQYPLCTPYTDRSGQFRDGSDQTAICLMFNSEYDRLLDAARYVREWTPTRMSGRSPVGVCVMLRRNVAPGFEPFDGRAGARDDVARFAVPSPLRRKCGGATLTPCVLPV